MKGWGSVRLTRLFLPLVGAFLSAWALNSVAGGDFFSGPVFLPLYSLTWTGVLAMAGFALAWRRSFPPVTQRAAALLTIPLNLAIFFFSIAYLLVHRSGG